MEMAKMAEPPYSLIQHHILVECRPLPVLSGGAVIDVAESVVKPRNTLKTALIGDPLDSKSAQQQIGGMNQPAAQNVFTGGNLQMLHKEPVELGG